MQLVHSYCLDSKISHRRPAQFPAKKRPLPFFREGGAGITGSILWKFLHLMLK